MEDRQTNIEIHIYTVVIITHTSITESENMPYVFGSGKNQAVKLGVLSDTNGSFIKIFCSQRR